MSDADAKKLIEQTLSSMGIGFEGIDVSLDPATAGKVFVIRTNESGLLIGDHGEHYQALAHLLKRMAEKAGPAGGEFFIDVNDYRSSIAEKLKAKAAELAEEARAARSDIELEPMSSYERLVIHGALAGMPHIKTESSGEGKDRRVVIKYIEEPAQ